MNNTTACHSFPILSVKYIHAPLLVAARSLELAIVHDCTSLPTPLFYLSHLLLFLGRLGLFVFGNGIVDKGIDFEKDGCRNLVDIEFVFIFGSILDERRWTLFIELHQHRTQIILGQFVQVSRKGTFFFHGQCILFQRGSRWCHNRIILVKLGQFFFPLFAERFLARR